MSNEDRIRDALDRALADARERLEPELRAVTHELSAASAEGLASAAEALEGAGSLTEVLRALVSAVAQHAERVGLFLVRDGRVHPWQLNGVDAAAVSSARVDRVTTFPITVGGRIVAILYADAAASHAGALDLLTRYAGRLLESRTFHMALGIAAR